MAFENLALQKVEEIKEIIINDCSYNTISILGGATSNIIFLHRYLQYRNDEIVSDALVDTINYCIDSIENHKLLIADYSVLSGFLWTMKYLEVVDSENFAGVVSVDNFTKSKLVERVDSFIENSTFDLFNGAIGITKYLDMAFPEDYHYKKLLNIDLCQFYERGEEIILGMAHGIPSMISYLSNFPTKETYNYVNRLIEEIVLRSKRPENVTGISLYPDGTTLSKVNEYQSRVGWCYGDLSIALCLWKAGEAFNKNSWRNEAMTILLHTATRREQPETLVVDAGLCHGSAGIAQIFRHFNDRVNLKELNQTYNYWIDYTLHLAKYNDGAAGYKALVAQDKWEKDNGLLEGIAGIGLVLLDYVDKEAHSSLNWSSCLLID